MKQPPPVVKVGQFWKHNDPRMDTRPEMEVVSIEGEYAMLKSYSGRTTRVRISRMRPTSSRGWSLKKDI